MSEDRKLSPIPDNTPTREEKVFYILSIDGGGIRGIYAAQLLANLEQKYHVAAQELFDFIAGTSAGAIIGGAAATGIPMSKIVQLFETEGPHIFRKKWYRHPLLFSRYSKRQLEKPLAAHLPAIALNQISKPLMITCSDLSTGGSYLFRSNYLEKQGKSPPPQHASQDSPDGTHRNVTLRQAVLASCAAPTFFDPNLMGKALLADGSFWANNPAIAALTEAISTLGQEIEKIKILSIGTGHSQNMYRNRRNWGFITGWGGQKITSYVLSVQSQATAEMAQRLLKERYLRINSIIHFWELDDVSQLAELKHLADRDFKTEAEKIQRFINL